jgi:hypothetical protein
MGILMRNACEVALEAVLHPFLGSEQGWIRISEGGRASRFTVWYDALLRLIG